MRKDFKDFLTDLPEDCDHALTDYFGSLYSDIADVTFYDLDSKLSDGTSLGAQPASPYVGPYNGNLTTWFVDTHNGNIYGTATTVFRGSAPAPGIYFAGRTGSFWGNNGMYLLLHEMMHFVTNQRDEELAGTLGVRVGAGESPSDAISDWFLRGCRNN